MNFTYNMFQSELEFVLVSVEKFLEVNKIKHDYFPVIIQFLGSRLYSLNNNEDIDIIRY